MSKKLVRNAMKTRHPSLEMTDPECVAKKKPDVLTKARNKFWNLSDVLKHSKNHPENDKKQKPHSTLEYFLRSHHKDKIFSNSSSEDRRAGCLQKQNSLGTYPIRIEITDDDEERISRTRPATVCLARVLREDRDTDALALERPRKKLSFREPEISTNSDHNKTFPYKIKRSCSDGNDLTRRSPSFEDVELESQAMRVVRTIGQAFEVCHKLSITAPEQEHVDQDEQETLTQDLISESLSDSCDKQKRDISDCASDRASFTQEDNPKTAAENRKNLRSLQLDILPPPSSQDKKSPLTSAETYSSPHSDVLMSTGSGSGGSASLPPPGSALSSHHELQLLREQLEQQSQQTQAAMAQLQLAREQLAAEQSARMEAQARTHQLLVHNRELLDHIAALVAHLQDGEKASGQHQQSSPHVAMPQLSSTAKVERWFELIEPLSISRPESGFVSCQDQEADDDDDERAILEGTKNLLSKLSARKQRKLLGLKLGKVTTF